MSSPLVSVCVVTWNHRETVRACVESILAQTYKPLELIIVDNASTDGTAGLVQAYSDRGTVILNDENTGYCGGNNQAIRAGSGEFVLLVNPDVVLDPAYVAEGVRRMQTDPRIGTLCGQLLMGESLSEADRMDGTGLQVSRSRRFSLRDHGLSMKEVARSGGPVFGSDGSLPMYRREMIEAISFEEEFFDEAFFAHKEAFDVAWRAQIMGWTAYYEPLCRAVHAHFFKPRDLELRKRVDPAIKRHAVKNDLLLLLKNEFGMNAFLHAPFIAARQAAIFLYLLLAERSSLPAYRYIAGNRAAIRRKRNWIMRQRRVSAARIRALFRNEAPSE